MNQILFILANTETADAVGLLSNLSPKDVLFIDEIHRIPKSVEEYLYSAMEDFRVDFITGTGAFAKTLNKLKNLLWLALLLDLVY